MRSYLLSQFISVTSVLPSTLGGVCPTVVISVVSGDLLC